MHLKVVGGEPPFSVQICEGLERLDFDEPSAEGYLLSQMRTAMRFIEFLDRMEPGDQRIAAARLLAKQLSPPLPCWVALPEDEDDPPASTEKLK